MRHVAEEGWEDALAELPAHLQPGIRAYIEHHTPFGGFLQAVVANDLADAVARMNPASMYGLKRTVEFFHNYAPALCHGSRAAYEAWIAPPPGARCRRCGEELLVPIDEHECKR